MRKPRKAAGKAPLEPDAESPLSAALANRDGGVLDMVAAAIRHRDVLLAFQAVHQGDGAREVAFYEGFVRVLDETGRVIPAKDFMAQAERSEIGRELDCITLDLGLTTLARNPDIRLSLNLSARSIGFRKWNRILETHLQADATLGERLMLEFSETSAIAVPELVIDFIDHLQPHGIAFALDDFGAGATAMRHLRDFCFDAVKLHGPFVRGIARDPDNQTLVRALVAVAREFDMLVIANSVESREDDLYLREIGVDCMQGYLFGAPSVTPPWQAETAPRRKVRGA